MSTYIDAPAPVSTQGRPITTDLAAAGELNYLTNGGTIRSWLLTGDHKRIAVLYIVTTTIAFLIGALAAALVRLELITPEGDLMSSETYNRMFSAHGIVMVFAFLVPAVPATLGTFLIPLMIGARDLAFPKINLMSWYMYMAGTAFALYAIIAGGVDTGWTFYTPYSTTTNSNVISAALGAFVIGFSSIFTGFNFIVTVHKMRAPGMTWFRLPLFVWSTYATSLIMILGTPVIGITVLMIVVERALHLGIFNPAFGGDPVLFQHLFWFYSHPAVYIMILPGFGVMSEIIPCFSRKNIFGYSFVAMSSLAIAMVGFFVWGHHLFVAGQSVYAGVVFSALSFLIAIPTAIKVFNWTVTLYKGSVSFDTPMLYAFGFIGLFLIGGLTGLFLSTLGLDVHLHDTYFVVAHFHYVMVGGMVLAYLGGLHFWWPKISGRMYPELLGKLSALIVYIGFNLTFFPQFIMGYMGMPRQYHTYVPEFQVYHVLSTAGASVLGIGFLMPIIYLTYSWKYGPRAVSNPWKATGLEWQTTSPPPTVNFLEIPVITSAPYEYAEIKEDRLVHAR
jgi:cytochrome c oxidase subunit 1